MALEYSAVQWNRQKRIYDFVLAGGVGAFLVLFGVLSKVLFPFITDEIMLMRAFAAAAFVLLHVILCIGPLCRLNRMMCRRTNAAAAKARISMISSVMSGNRTLLNSPNRTRNAPTPPARTKS